MRALVIFLLLASSVACTQESSLPTQSGTVPPVPIEMSTALPSLEPSATPQLEPLNKWVTVTPPRLGRRVLPKGPDGFGIAGPTPRVLRNRRLATVDLFPPPDSKKFEAELGPVPPSVLERSTWREKCPVTPDQLSYIKVTFFGFDHLPHTGEMIVNASVAEDVVEVFRRLYEARFPIEQMRVWTLREQRAGNKAPTGDTNTTASFECRKATLGNSWSQHAYGLAIDINPFHNPYLRGDLVLPELASAYVERSWVRPGMITEGDVVTQAFDAIGWGWGGRWNSVADWMHFSLNGR